jgi:hypothetical protein
MAEWHSDASDHIPQARQTTFSVAPARHLSGDVIAAACFSVGLLGFW